jgi:uncharacterized protein YecE (DUF72 family)
MAQVYIGTSGWVYKSWAKEFYPEDVPAKYQFQFYVTQFPSVEINATFYRLPTKNMVRGWRDKAPEGFRFSVKGSRYITHIKRLANLESSLSAFTSRIEPLKGRTGPLLWQLPPSFKKDALRLERFLKRLPKKYRHAVEFRHESWFDDEVFALLRSRNAAHVAVSSLRIPMNLTVTADFLYIRFHGLEGGSAHDYTSRELEPWARFLRQQAAAGHDGYVYFNNDTNVRAPHNAMLLMELVGRAAAQPFAADYTAPRKKSAALRKAA